MEISLFITAQLRWTDFEHFQKGNVFHLKLKTLIVDPLQRTLKEPKFDAFTLTEGISLEIDEMPFLFLTA